MSVGGSTNRRVVGGAVREPPLRRAGEGSMEVPKMGPTNLQHHRRSIRLKGYDYSQPGAYFITVCVRGGEFLFGDVATGRMRLNNAGTIVQKCWEWLERHYGHVRLDEYVVMPNHLHGIIMLIDPIDVIGGAGRGGSRTAPTAAIRQITRKPLGRLIGAFKTVTTKKLNHLRDRPGQTVWQRGYFEHIIRNGHALERIREYISSNPVQWNLDDENPGQTGTDNFDEWLMSRGRDDVAGIDP